MSKSELRAWLWGSGTACMATGCAFSLHDPSAGGVGGISIIIGVILCVQAFRTSS